MGAPFLNFMSKFEGIPNVSDTELNPRETGTYRLEKLQAEKEEVELQNEKKGARQESGEKREDLKENDLIVSDDGVVPAKNILEKNKIQYKDREYTKKQIINADSGTAIPGEFVLTIFDPEHPERPASFNFVKKILNLIKDSDIAVRYGKNPERE